MSWSFPIGRLFGIELRVHATFFLLLAWIGLMGWSAGGAPAAAISVLYIVILFICVVAHEFGHALMARRFGIRTPDVTLLPIGGLARLERMPTKPMQEVAVALAGPAVNVVVFLVLWALFGLAPADTAITDLTLSALPGQIAVLNLVLAVFNLLPAFPMDGGRVLRALLATRMDRMNATRAAAAAGQGLAFAMGLYGLLSGNPLLILIAFFVFISAGAESSDAQMRGVARGLMARDAMITEFEPLAPDDSLEAAASALIRTTQHEFPVIEPGSGQLMGFLTRTALFKALQQEHRPRLVAQVMVTRVPTARLTDGLEAVLARMDGGAPAVAVLGTDDRMIGYVTRENLGELMVVANSRKS